MPLVVDIGSLWGRTEKSAMRAIRALHRAGITYIKCQLCPREGGNIPIPYDYLGALVRYGDALGAMVSCTAWDEHGYHTILACKPAWVKFAWSSPRQWMDAFLSAPSIEHVVITTKQGEAIAYNHLKIVRLWTAEVNGIPVYPAPAQNHTGKYKKTGGVYDGYSCHCKDPAEVAAAIAAGALWVEVHGNPLAIQGPPDAEFALSMPDLEKLIKTVNG